jgi:hypothetical protein
VPLQELFRDSFESAVAYDRPSWAHAPAEVLVNGHLSISSADYDPADNEFAPSMIPNITVDPTNFCAVVHMRVNAYDTDPTLRAMAFIYMGVDGPDLTSPAASVGFKGSGDASTDPHIFTYNGTEAGENPVHVDFFAKDFWLVTHCDGTNLVLDYYEESPFLGAAPVATTQSVWDPASDHVERRFGFEMNGGPGSVVYSWIVYEGQGALPLVAPNLVFDDDFRLDTSGDYDKSTWATDPLVISDGRLNISREVVPVGGEVNITAKNMRFSPEEGAAIAIKCHVEADGVTSGYLYPMFGATDTEDTGAWWGGIDVGLPGPAGTAIRAIAGAGQVFNAQNTEIPSPFDGWIIMRAYNDEVGHAYTLQGAYNGEVQARRAGAYSAGVSVMVVAGGAAGTVRYQFRDSADVLLFETPDFATYQDAQAWSATNPDWMITINVLDTAALPYGPFPLERKDCIQTEAWDGHPAEGGTKLAEVAGPFFAPMRGNRFAVEALGTAGSYIDRMLVYEGVGALPAPPAPPEPPAPQIPSPPYNRITSLRAAAGIRPPSEPLHKRLRQKGRNEPRKG